MKAKNFIVGLMCGVILMGSTSIIAKTGKSLIEVMYKNMKIVVDGTELNMPVGIEPFTYNGTTYLPVRAVSEALGKEISYDTKTATVYLGEKPEQVAKTVTLEEAISEAQVIENFLSVLPSYYGENFIYNKGVKVPFTNRYYSQNGNGDVSKMHSHTTFYTNGKYSKLKFKLVIPEGSDGSILIGEDSELKQAVKTGSNVVNAALFSTKDVLAGEIDGITSSYKYGQFSRVESGMQVIDYEVDISHVEILTIILGNNMYMLDPVLITATK